MKKIGNSIGTKERRKFENPKGTDETLKITTTNTTNNLSKVKQKELDNQL